MAERSGNQEDKAGEKKLILVDGMALAYRGHFAFMKNPRINTKNLNTSSIYVFANTLLQLLEQEQPSHIAVVFDTKEPTHRHKEYPAYKATREAMPEWPLGSRPTFDMSTFTSITDSGYWFL